MPAASKNTRHDRSARAAPLDRARIVGAALGVMDRTGAERLTARAVAAELGVTPMALYRHVPNMEALGVGVFERVIEEARLLEVEAESIDAFLVETFSRIYEAFVTHPGSLRLLSTPASLSSAAVSVMTRCMGRLSAHGVDEARAVSVFHSFLAYTLGGALLTAALEERDRGRRGSAATGAMRDIGSRETFVRGLEERVMDALRR
jgi:TetR/AcrR family transcriptional regulator, tetracycline repressor protein